jgi:hypothetical protein
MPNEASCAALPRRCGAARAMPGIVNQNDFRH